MASKLFSLRKRGLMQAAGAALGAILLVLPATGAHAQPACRLVVGHYEEHLVTVQEGCQSPAGLCIAGEYTGMIKGQFEGTATSLVPTSDTGTTGVVLFTSDSVIHASIGGKAGNLTIKNAGAVRTTGSGDIVDLQFITGGDGELSGASGTLRASGTFDPATGMGESEYIGSICLP